MQRWFYDEMIHSGVDYANPAQVQVYDERHQKLRNYPKFSAEIMNILALGPEPTIIDMGSGTGAFTLNAAPLCKHIFAADVSLAMLNYCREKAIKLELENIDFCHGGFLTYNHRFEPADAMVSVAALHHLPDFWKFIGLRRAAAMIRPEGRLYLFDVVFPSNVANYEARFDGWIQSIGEKAGAEFAAEATTHIRDEYSTYDWIMEGFLEKAGFRIDSAEYTDALTATYVCTKL